MIYNRGNKQRRLEFSRVASSTVEYSAFNRLVLGSNPRRPIFFVQRLIICVTLPITLPLWKAYALVALNLFLALLRSFLARLNCDRDFCIDSFIAPLWGLNWLGNAYSTYFSVAYSLNHRTASLAW